MLNEGMKAKSANAMPILVTEIETELSAYDVFCLFRNQPSVTFLDSRLGYGELSRYSILGLDPYLSLRGWPGKSVVNGQPLDEDPFDVLERLLLENRTAPVGDLPLVGGCMGTIAYDAGFPLVDLPLPQRVIDYADESYPLVSFDFYDLILIFDHQTGKTTAQVCGRLSPPEDAIERLRDRLCRCAPGTKTENEQAETNAGTSATIQGFSKFGNTAGASGFSDPGPSDDRNFSDFVPGTKSAPSAIPIPCAHEYIAKVEAVRELIRQGEVYIANLTHVFSTRTDRSAEALYDRLRRLNPAPFAAFVRQGEQTVLSASPERLLRLSFTESGSDTASADATYSHTAISGTASTLATNARQLAVETRPIKGTRPRGRDAAEDMANAETLMDSAKDRSELLMIVDLERNDLSRVCLPESVRVPELFRLETFPTVFHLVATVTGILRDDVSAMDCIRCCFPGGSITGAPKVAAMQIIDRLEDNPRSLYTGCLGYFSLDGQADFNILIRSLFMQGNQVRYGSGGGITWESDAHEEYLEMLVKARSFLQVMGEE